MSRPRSVFISINTEKFPFNNPKIRKAFAFAINRRELMGVIGKGVKKNIKDQMNLAYQSGISTTNLILPSLKENRSCYFFKDKRRDDGPRNYQKAF